MPVKIVVDPATGVVACTDADTGAPVRDVTRIQLDLTARREHVAVVTTLAPSVDVTVSRGSVSSRCPFCGHEADVPGILVAPERAIRLETED